MKKTILSGLIFFAVAAHGQNVGIGTNTPVARLHVTDSAVLFSGPVTIPAITPFGPPASGVGSRMFWYPQKAAFRAGIVDGTQWNKDNIGRFSLAAGLNSIASGEGAVSFGNSNTASGDGATSIGNTTIASGQFSTTMGLATIAGGPYTISTGEGSQASGYASFSMGEYTSARGESSVSMGYSTIARSPNSLVIGQNNDTSNTSSTFEIGNGSSVSSRSNALTVLMNGNVGMGTVNPVTRLHVADSSVLFSGPVTIPSSTPFGPPASGAGSRMFWYPEKAAFRAGIVDGAKWDKDSIGRYSFAAGFDTKASGQGAVSLGESTTASGAIAVSLGKFTTATGNIATSMGNSTTAFGDYSTSMGNVTIASGFSSTSMGNGTIASGFSSTSMGAVTTASGDYSTSMGEFTKASGNLSTSMGYRTIAKSDYSLVIGKYNDSTNTNTLFEIGDGTASNNLKNAVTVQKNGYVGIGNNFPDALLSFPAGTGEKIVLYPYAPFERHGISVFSNGLYSAMRFYVPSTADYVSWGYGSNSTFTENMSLDGTGVLRVRTSVIAPYVFAPSDARFKTGLQTITSPVEKIKQLNGYTYYYKTNDFPDRSFSNREQVGLIAQEVESVLPQAVNTDADGYKSVDYAKLVPLLVEALKAQQEEIEKLKKLVGVK